jgi:hypothetical protein
MAMPGQKEQLEMFFPGGKMEFDYALKGDQLFFASATGSQMQDLLEGKLNRPSSIELEKNTFVAGSFNLLEAIKRIAGTNPMVPEEARTMLSKLDPQGTSIEFQTSADNNLHATLQVPLKLLREMGRLQPAF